MRSAHIMSTFSMLLGLLFIPAGATIAADHQGIQPGTNFQLVKGHGGSGMGGGPSSRSYSGGSGGSSGHPRSGGPSWSGSSRSHNFSYKGNGPKGNYNKWSGTKGSNNQWDGSKGKHRRHGRHGYYYYPYDDFYGWPYDYGYDYDYDGYYYGNYYSGCNYYRHRWYVTHNRYWLRRYYQCLDY